MNLQTILSRIAKLRAISIERGSSETEAAYAQVQLAKLIAEYNISEAQIGHHTTAADFVEDFFAFHSTTEWTRCCNAIGEVFSTQSFLGTWNDEMLGSHSTINFYGTAPDVQASLALAKICHLAILAASTTWLQHNSKKNLGSFQGGMANRLAARIRELRAAAPAAGQAIVIARHAQVKEAWAASHPGRWVTTKRHFNSIAAGAGAQAANNVRLGVHKEVGQVLRLGQG